ncbi:2-O-methyltransferase NoeI [Ensifer psoraleae]|nr:2-O-methyltransferase NoeI [Sinorhizobium psoraleae]
MFSLNSHRQVVSLLQKPDPVILDIGCNDGTDTRRFLRLCPKAKFYCFEPDPRAAARFKKDMNLYMDKVKLFEIALSNRNGEIDFHPSNGEGSAKEWDQSGSIRRPKNHLVEHDWVRFDGPISVATRTLDAWSSEANLNKIDFICMDVRADESDVIAAPRQTLSNTRFIYTETATKNSVSAVAPCEPFLIPCLRSEVVPPCPTRSGGDVLLRNTSLYNRLPLLSCCSPPSSIGESISGWIGVRELLCRVRTST